MKLDIQTGIQTAFIITLLLGLVSFMLGVRSLRSGAQLQYFRIRHDRVMAGWRMIFVGVVFGLTSFVVNRYAPPVVYRIYPPSPTVTMTPTITTTPTITATPTITLTPTITNTPSVTNTPALPAEVATQFQSTVTPVGTPIFSKLRFARKLDKTYQPIDAATEFANPIQQLYGVFTYDKMTPKAEWSALWYRDGTLVFFETIPWNGGTGGIGYTNWNPPSGEWLPGTYEVQIFVGSSWIVSGQFTVTGTPPTSAPTTPPTRTLTPTPTFGPSPTRTASSTPTPSNTPTITLTPTPSRTPRPTDTRLPTLTSAPLQ